MHGRPASRTWCGSSSSARSTHSASAASARCAGTAAGGGLLDVIARLLRMIKFSHSVFALPFALAAMLLAADGLPPWRTVGWIVVAMVAARSAAMAFNRLVDRDIDRKNPRTAGREM